MSDRNDAEVIAEIVSDHMRDGQVIELDERKVLLTIGQDGATKVVPMRDLLAPYDTRPRRREGIAYFEDLDSFVAHANRFKGSTSALFGSRGKTPQLVSVLDYHQAGEDTDGERARFGRHRGSYRFPLSAEWQAWHNPSLGKLGQQDFAEFLESRIVDVVDPKRAGDAIADLVSTLGVTLATPPRLLELSRGLQVRVNSKVAQQVTLASGEGQLLYAEEHADEKGAPLKIPTAFLIGIPVFEREDAYQLLVRLRYRVSQGAVTWALQVHDAERALVDAFEGSCKEAQEQTGLPLFFGLPEV